MTDSTRLASDPFPLNETALQKAAKAFCTRHTDFDGHLRDAISTYLREAGFEVEKRSILQQPHYRQVGPWLPVDQVEEEK